MENFFSAFRRNIVGRESCFESPFGRKAIVYADWTASGKAYRPIEDYLQREVLPFLANTHTGTTITGSLMSAAYEQAKLIIKQHVGAGEDEVLLFCGSGMTGAVNKLQRILGLRLPERSLDYMKEGCLQWEESLRPVVFVTSMEHHSNHISWLETIATVEVIGCDADGRVDLACFGGLLEQYRNRVYKIAAVTACSNVTGIETPYQEIAKMVHAYGGLCFVDFACSAPYVQMDMHPGEDEWLDAIYFSPHKFLGGPGTPGVLLFNKSMYRNPVPDQPGGGTVVYTNPWGGREYVTDIEQREDGGTPPFLPGIKVAMCIRLKEEMGVERMRRREEEQLGIVLERLAGIVNVGVLEGGVKERLGVVSFVVTGAHYNLITKLLNDRYGIQMRGGCSCAGTYGHQLLRVGKERSYAILRSIRSGDLSHKPGWVRLSLHPTMTDSEVHFILDAIAQVAACFAEWGADYVYDALRNEYFFKGREDESTDRVERWFAVEAWGD